MSSDKYCPFAGYNPPCGCCMMALRKNGMLFCGFAWDSATQTHGGRGNENKDYIGHKFGPWIENGVVSE